MQVTVIMASWLGDYQGAARDRVRKFRRAVDSFLGQTHPDKKLIVVADGCRQTVDILEEMRETWVAEGREQWLQSLAWYVMPRRGELFSGSVRNMGISLSRVPYGVISEGVTCYLDTDDMLLPGHLADIAANFGDAEWVYFNDWIALDGELKKISQRYVIPEKGRIGTSSIAHRRDLNISWPSGYGHDWTLVTDMMDRYKNYKRIRTRGYLVCHLPGSIDF